MKINPVYQHLDRALSRVRHQHPVRGCRGILAPNTSILDQVRQQLQQCPAAHLSELARKYDLLRLSACFEIIILDREGEIPEKACAVMIHRPSERFIEPGWFKLIALYEHTLLEKLIRELIQSKGFTALDSNKLVSDRIHKWFLVAQKLSMGVLRDHEKYGQSCLDTFLEQNYLTEDLGLSKAVWRELLLNGSAACLRKEEGEKILEKFQSPENAPYNEAFCAHYLNKLEMRQNWFEGILKIIEKKYSGPGKRNGEMVETAFWAKISDVAKEEFHYWQMQSKIVEFFEGERADFWKKYLVKKKIMAVWELRNVQGFMLDFKEFGVIEFKNIGNAAYIYPKDVFHSYRHHIGGGHFPGFYKNKNRTIKHKKMPSWDGRIIHNESWQYEAERKISILIG